MAKTKKEARELVVLNDGRKVTSCNLCPKLCESRSRIVNGHGPRHARIAVIAEAPGEVEDARGRPLIGPAGQTLRNWLRRIGVDPERDVYYDNAVRCHPEGDRTPSATEIRNCNAHLIRALKEIKPDIIVVAGNTALKALLPLEIAAQGITKARGHVFWHEELGRKIVPMYHPSAALYDWDLEPFCLFDLRKALRESKKPKEMTVELGDYKTLWTVEEIEQKCEELAQGDVLSFDCETDGLDWSRARILCLGLTNTVGKAWVIPFVGQNYREVWKPREYQRVIAAIAKLFSSDVPKIGQNGKFDMHMLREHGIDTNAFMFDTMLGYALINESGSHALEPMRSLFTTMPFYDGEVYRLSDGKKHMELCPEDVLHQYCGADVDCTLRAAKEIDRLIDEEDPGVRWVFDNITMPLVGVTMRMEQRGILVDEELATRLVDETDDLIRKFEREVLDAVPQKFAKACPKGQFNHKSAQQKQKLLYEYLKLPMPPILTKTGSKCKVCRTPKRQHWYHTSTDKNAIKALKGAHDIIEPLNTLTQLTTLRKTFLLGEDGEGSGLLHHVKGDSRIHTQYRIDGTETGRMSTSPNLQNIPKDTDDRPEVYQLIRKLFVAPKGKLLIECDYANLELRVLAYITQEKELIRRFEANEDVHTYVARHILFKGLDESLTDAEWAKAHKNLRDMAKTFNFGLAYGLTVFGLMQRFNCSEKEAQTFISEYFRILTKVHQYFRDANIEIKKHGTRKNCFGRTRHFNGVRTMQHYGGYKRQLGHIRREGYNYTIQSSGSDLLSLATIAIDADPWFEDHDTYIVLSVHDSVTVEAPLKFAEEAARRVLAHMQDIPMQLLKWYIPAEAKAGPRWSVWDWTIDASGNFEEVKKAA